MLTQIQIPEKLNKSLRIYAIETGLGNREKTIIYILESFFKQLEETN